MIKTETKRFIKALNIYLETLSEEQLDKFEKIVNLGIKK